VEYGGPDWRVPDLESRAQWRQKLTEERNKRLDRYREKMVGRQSLWRVWRSELPSGPQLRVAALAGCGHGPATLIRLSPFSARSDLSLSLSTA